MQTFFEHLWLIVRLTSAGRWAGGSLINFFFIDQSEMKWSATDHVSGSFNVTSVDLFVNLNGDSLSLNSWIQVAPGMSTWRQTIHLRHRWLLYSDNCMIKLHFTCVLKWTKFWSFCHNYYKNRCARKKTDNWKMNGRKFSPSLAILLAVLLLKFNVAHGKILTKNVRSLMS